MDRANRIRTQGEKMMKFQWLDKIPQFGFCGHYELVKKDCIIKIPFWIGRLKIVLSIKS
ncbi:MAG: hypothetical protein ABR936_11850 [Bacteroidota bacterium]